MSKTQKLPFMDRLILLMSRWSRATRIALATLITILTTGLVMGIVALFLPDGFYEDTGQSQLLLVALVVVGFITYGIGWQVLVGFDDAPWQASRRAAQYVLWGVAVLIASILGIIAGLFYGYVA